MALKENILQKGIELYQKVKDGTLNLKYGEYRDNGMLDFNSSTMDCSMFILKITSQVSDTLFKSLAITDPGDKYGGNTTTIKNGIMEIEGLTDLSRLGQTNPQKGDWLIWKGHVEIVKEVNANGTFVLLGANGAQGGSVPKLTVNQDMTKVKVFAANFLGIWSPKENNFIAEDEIKA